MLLPIPYVLSNNLKPFAWGNTRPSARTYYAPPASKYLLGGGGGRPLCVVALQSLACAREKNQRTAKQLARHGAPCAPARRLHGASSPAPLCGLPRSGRARHAPSPARRAALPATLAGVLPLRPYHAVPRPDNYRAASTTARHGAPRAPARRFRGASGPRAIVRASTIQPAAPCAKPSPTRCLSRKACGWAGQIGD